MTKGLRRTWGKKGLRPACGLEVKGGKSNAVGSFFNVEGFLRPSFALFQALSPYLDFNSYMEQDQAGYF